jgi:hypothetical protein
VKALFGIAWEELGIADIERFLETAGNEGLTWEAKGDSAEHRWPRRQQIEKAVSGFANSNLGGVLIIGAERRSRQSPGWDLPGLEPPGAEEVDLALGQTIDTGVHPAPHYRVKSWPRPNGRAAALVWVPPVAQPPSITRDGLVFQRATGRTEPVTDQGALARLFDRGDRARLLAERKALAAAAAALETPEHLNPAADRSPWPPVGEHPRAALTLAAAGYDHDIGGRLYQRGFGGRMLDLAKTLRVEWVVGRDSPQGHEYLIQRRGWVAAVRDEAHSPAHAYRWIIRADWSGAVSILCCLPTEAGGELPERVLQPAWTVAMQLLRWLGGVGSAHLVICGVGELRKHHEWPPPNDPIRRWIDLPATPPQEAGPGTSDLAYITAELDRQAGQERWT